MPGESLILINPRRRRRARARQGNPRKRRMPAGLRRYWASRRGTRLANPRRRRRTRSYRRNPIVHSYRRRRPRSYRRNPRRRAMPRSYRRLKNPRGDFMHTLVAGAVGAGGALLLNIGYGWVSPYLPTTMQTGLVQTAVLGVGALGLGYLVGRFVDKEIGDDVAFGGLSVVLYNAAYTIAKSAGVSLPSNALSGYGDYTPRRLGAYMQGVPNTAGFRAGKRPGMGYISPAPVVRSGMGAYMRGVPNTSGFRHGLGAYMRPAPMNVASAGGNWGDGM